MSKSRSQKKFRLKKNLTLGALDAEHDPLLHTAFLDTDTLPVLCDTRDRRSIVAGRTGSGKTALLLRLEDSEYRVARIKPDAFSLNYLTNSTILPYLTNLGVHLNLFYKWLWRHAIVLELIGAWAAHEGETRRENFFDSLLRRLGPKTAGGAKKLIDYRQRWGTQFWQHTERSIKELIETLDANLKADLGAEYNGLKLGVTAGSQKNTVVKTEVLQRTQQIVNETQLHELNAVLGLVREHILSDPLKPYFIVIDDLDKEWVDREYTYELTDALVEEVGEFAKIPNIKVIIALRDNIVEQLHRHQAEKRGRQREKHEDMMLRLTWTERELEELADLRVLEVLRGQYSGISSLSDILPSMKHHRQSDGGATAKQYIIDRTMLRPRDLISFLNKCIQAAVQKDGTITWEVISTAELRYSGERLGSLEDEWKENYPDIGELFSAFRRIEDGFHASEVSADRLTALCAVGEASEADYSVARQIYRMIWENDLPVEHVVRGFIVPLLFQIGFLGVKQSPSHPTDFVFQNPALLDSGVWDGAAFYIHPALYRALDVQHPYKGRAEGNGTSGTHTP